MRAEPARERLRLGDGPQFSFAGGTTARRLVWLLAAVVVSASAWATAAPGAISGTVRNSAGVAQMGATVQVFGSKGMIPVVTAYTDAKGFFQTFKLDPGTYFVRVSAPSFLPSVREDIGLKAGANLVVNITLNTLFEAMQMMPMRHHSPEDQDEWKWVLRSGANRPILRVLDDGPLVVVSKDDNGDKTLKASVAFLAGADAAALAGPRDMTTTFKVERSLFSSGTVALDGDVGYAAGGTSPGGVLRASYSQQLPNGSAPQVGVTMRRFVTPDMAMHDAALQALAVSLADNVSVADLVDVSFGSEYQTIQFMNRVSALRPFGSADLHLSPNTTVEYQYASSVPNTRAMKGYDTAPADLSESGPRVSIANYSPVIEDAHHNEVSLSRRAGDNRFQVAWFSDRISGTALNGVGMVSVDSGQYMPDIYSSTFTWNGPDLNTEGMRAVVQRKITPDVTATLDYSYGGVLALDEPGSALSEIRSAIATEHRHALAYKMAGTLPVTHTRWIASYRWTSGTGALTPVDMFNTSAGQTDPYLSIFIRQPLPVGFMGGRMDALIDVRNLMAQGYVPVMGDGGHTLYLVQSARVFRGGLSFTF